MGGTNYLDFMCPAGHSNIPEPGNTLKLTSTSWVQDPGEVQETFTAHVLKASL